MNYSSKYIAGIVMVVLCLSWLPSAFAYTVFLDELVVTRNGSTFFTDSFDDGLPPPSAPDGRQYITTGGFGPETGDGKLTLDSADAVCGTSVFGNDRCIQRAILQTNNDSTNLSSGLKIGDIFSVTGIFDLTDPSVLREKYGIRLTDRNGPEGTPPNGNDIIEIAVRRTLSDQLTVRLRRLDLATATSTILETQPLDLLLGDQIALSLSRDSTTSNAITASFSYLNGGLYGAPIEFTAKPEIFNGEGFTRAAFVATSPVPLPASVWLFGSGLIGLIGIARRKKS